MPISKEELESRIKTSFPDAEIEIKDLAGDNDHFEARIASAQFSGVPLVKQHKMVMDALGSIVGNELHALSIKTKTK